MTLNLSMISHLQFRKSSKISLRSVGNSTMTKNLFVNFSNVQTPITLHPNKQHVVFLHSPGDNALFKKIEIIKRSPK